MTLPRRARLAALAGALLVPAALAQDPADPFRAPAPDPFGAPAPDPFATPAPVTSATPFDPAAVETTRRGGVWLGPVELHGRANLTLSTTHDRDGVELLRPTSLELSSADLYAQWFPCRWFGLLAEVELESDLEEDARAVEVEPELLVLEARPLGDDRLRLRAGYFPVPFGLERRYYAPPRNELANRPAAFRRVFPSTFSDWGVMAWGRLPLGVWGSELELEAALTRGLEGPLGRGDRPAPLERDENHEPQLTGRVGWTLLDLSPDVRDAPDLVRWAGVPLRLALGASLLLGHHDDEARERVLLLGFDAGVTVGDLSARAEVILGEVEAPAPGARARRVEGLYAVVAWRRRFGAPWLEEGFVAVRYDVADPDARARDGHDVERWHVGLGWSPFEGVLLKLGLELARQGAERPRTAFLELGYSF